MPDHAPQRLCPACLLRGGSTAGEATTVPGAPECTGIRGVGAAPAERFAPGTVIGDRYRIIAPLGRGGMGEVYRADDLTLNLPVALKFLPRAVADDAELLEILYNEVRQARRVSDRHVCRIHDVGHAGGLPFLSMELIEGENLASLLRRIGRLPGDKAIELGRQLCTGMAAAHREGLLHLDLKPSNLMINQSGDLVIADFGLSRLIGESGGRGRRAGTPAYMAPEHLLSGEVSEACDIYAIGLILHEMFGGRPFHGSRSLDEIIAWHRDQASRGEEWPEAASLPAELERLVRRCLAIDPSRRPESVAEILSELEGIRAGHETRAALPPGRSSRSGKTLAVLLFTDIVGSVELQQSLGTEAYTRLVAEHDRIFRDCLAECPESAILNETGDGFLVRFADPADAVRTALRLQARLAAASREDAAIRIRIGLHMGLVTEMTEGLRGERRAVGMPINLASRVMSLGEAGQILMTRPVYDDARQFIRQHPDASEPGGGECALEWLSHGLYRFAGHDEPAEIFEVGVRGLAPLSAPAGSDKAKRLLPEERPTRRDGGPVDLPPEAVRESDIYICCSPVDDRPLTPGQEGWISQFHRHLETRIEQLSGEPVKVIQRPPLTDDRATEDLVAAVPGAKAMVSVVSPPFVKSRECAREAEVFWKSAREAGNLRLEDRTRLLKVVKTPVPEADLPEPLAEVFADLLSFDFYSIDPQTGRLWEFDEAFGVEARRQYYERVYDLSYELCHVLRAFQAGSEAGAPPRAAGRTVFLAETTGDLRQARDRLKRELLERGHVVLPDRPLPLVGPQLEASVRECLDRSSLAVHLVGSVYGLVPEEAEHSVVETQNRIAAEHARAAGGGFSRLIWIPRERPEPEPRQAEFLRRLAEDPAAQFGADLVEDSLEEFKELVIDALVDRSDDESQHAGAGVREHPGTPLVYLICDPADEEAVEPLEDHLFEQGFEVSVPSFDGTESEIAAIHRQNLVNCDAALIYYGAASRGWVETKLMDLQQAPGYGRRHPLLAKIVYVAPPFDRRKERFRTHHARVIRPEDGAGTWDPRILADFVDDVKSQTSIAS